MQPQQTTCTIFYQNQCNKSQKQLQLGIRKLRKKKKLKTSVSVYDRINAMKSQGFLRLITELHKKIHDGQNKTP